MRGPLGCKYLLLCVSKLEVFTQLPPAYERGVNRGMQIRYDLLTKSAVKFSPWIRNPGRNICTTRKVQIRGQKIDESAFLCSCKIRKSVKISLWIRNPGINIFKIRRSVRLFTPLLQWKFLNFDGVLQSFPLIETLRYPDIGVRVRVVYPYT